MKINFPVINTMMHQAQMLETQELEVSAFTGWSNGHKSHNLTISIEGKNMLNKTEDECFISFDLNKNQALYLLNFLDAFIHEKEIDPDLED